MWYAGQNASNKMTKAEVAAPGAGLFSQITGAGAGVTMLI